MNFCPHTLIVDNKDCIGGRGTVGAGGSEAAGIYKEYMSPLFADGRMRMTEDDAVRIGKKIPNPFLYRCSGPGSMTYTDRMA